VIQAVAIAFVLFGAQSPEAAASAVVSGRVVDAATGRPISGVVIWAAGSAASSTPGASSPVRVMTTSAGAFVFRGLDRGSLVLTAVKGGYVNATPGQRRPGGSAQPIRVHAGARIDAGEIRMWKYASIAGTVLDEAGDPVVNTRVESLRRTFVAGRARFVDGPSAVTDDRGVYRIAGLTPADYSVVVPSTQTSVPTEVMDAFFGGAALTPGQRTELSREMNAIGSAIAPAGSSHAMRDGAQTFSLPQGTLTPSAQAEKGTVVYPTVFYPAAAGLAQASILTLRSGEERSGVDFQVRPVRAVPVSGVLLGPDGPAPTTAIRLLPSRDGDVVEPIEVATTMTDWTGAFTFAAVPPGQYELRVLRLPRPPLAVEDTTRVSVAAGGSMTVASNPVAAPAGPPPVPLDATLVAQLPLAVGESGIHDLVVNLAPGPRLSGRVEFVGTTDKPPAEAIRGMRILLDPVDGAPLFEPTVAMEAGHAEADGEFHTYGFPPGRYVLRVSPISAGWFLESAMSDGRDIADFPVDLQTKDVTGVVIVFTDRPSAVTGIVSGSQGADPTAVVAVYPTDSGLWTMSPRRLRTARAAPDGSFSIQGLPAGEYYVAALQEDAVGEWQDPALLRALTRVAQTIQLVEGEQKTVNLRAATVKQR
jgi:Carboxypeptidase regulatory-like domain